MYQINISLDVRENFLLRGYCHDYNRKKRVHVFEKNRSNIKDCGRIDNGKHDLSCNFVGGTTIVGQSKPMTILEPVSGNHDEDEVLKFINELSKGMQVT